MYFQKNFLKIVLNRFYSTDIFKWAFEGYKRFEWKFPDWNGLDLNWFTGLELGVGLDYQPLHFNGYGLGVDLDHQSLHFVRDRLESPATPICWNELRVGLDHQPLHCDSYELGVNLDHQSL